MSTRRSSLPLVRGTLLLAGGTVGGRGAWLLSRDPLLAVTGPLFDHGPSAVTVLPLETVLVGTCAAALVGCALWLLGCAALVVASYVARAVSPRSLGATALTRMADRRCPALLRHAVAAALGVSMASGVTTPAPAATPGAGPGSTGFGSTGTGSTGFGSTGFGGLTGLSLPDRTTGSVMATAEPRTVAARTVPLVPSVVLVRAGDSLWSITADLLSPHATDREITRGWHRLYRTNESRVGRDPDLIRPGTRLGVPDLTSPHRKELP